MVAKRILLSLLALLVSVGAAFAETKVVDRSAKKAPSWLGGAPNGCLVVTVQAPTMEQAQNRAQTELIERIMKAAGSNVSVSQESVESETTTGDGVDSRDEFTRRTTLRTANIPFVKGISLSKAVDIYWVKLLDKKTKKEYYEYSVQYPFTRMEQEMLSQQIEEMDAAKDSELRMLEQGVNEVEAYEQIKSCIGQLDALAEYFVDAPRLARVKSCRQQYNDLYKAIALTGALTEPNTIRCALTIDGHLLRTAFRPKVESSCASDIRVRSNDGEFIITFSTDDCLPDEDNTVTVSLRINSKTLKETFNI